MPAPTVTIDLDQFTTFGDLLKYLRRRAGLTQRELSIAVGYSVPQISRLEQNLRLPDLAMVSARFLPALQAEGEPQVAARLQALAAAVRREDAPAPGLPPYKGLHYFDEADAEMFFGREALTEQLVARLNGLNTPGQPTAEVRFLAILGASGSGKSSLVRAGLIPAVRWRQPSANWPVVVLTPTAHPLEALAAALASEERPSQTSMRLADELAGNTRALLVQVGRLVNGGAGTDLAGNTARPDLAPDSGINNSRDARSKVISPAPQQFLIIIDQFEELFTLCRSEAEQSAFVDNLLTAANETGGAAIVLIALRADFYAPCARFGRLREALARQQEFIGPMTATELRRAIEEPAKRGHWELEPGLVEVLLKDVGADGAHPPEPGALPLLSHALMETWQRRRGQTLTLSGYMASGGVRGAIAETAEAVFQDQLDPAQRAIARQIFLRLTELGEDGVTADTRRRATFAELIPGSAAGGALREVLQLLADARLITVEQDAAEVAHEALIREWPTLRGWLEDDRQGLRLHRQLTEAAQAWLKLEREAGALYRGLRLAQAWEWTEFSGKADALNALELEFLHESREFAEREVKDQETQRQRELEAAQKLAEAQRQRAEDQVQAAGRLQARNRLLTVIGAAALLLALAAGAFGALASQNAGRAELETNLALSRQLAAQAASLPGSQPDLAMLLNVEASRLADTAEARQALLTGLQEQPAAPVRLRGHNNHVFSAAFSPDGRALASVGADQTVLLWDLATRQPIGQPLLGHTGTVDTVAFSPDGKIIASGGYDDHLIFLWDAATHQRIGPPLSGHTDHVEWVTFSPDGRTLASASDDNTIILWDVAAHQAIGPPLAGHSGRVWVVAFSPDGQTLASANDDMTIVMWDVATHQPRGAPLARHTGPVYSVAFSPDGKTLASASADRSIILWDVSTRQPISQPLTGHIGAVISLGFSPDGKWLASGSVDSSSILWNVATHKPTGPPFGSPRAEKTDWVTTVAFSPDGRTLAAASTAGSATLWDMGPRLAIGQPLGVHGKAVLSVAFSPDGKLLASGGADNTIRLWDVTTHPIAGIPLASGEMTVTSLAFSPDGRTMAWGSDDHTIVLWDVATRQPLGPPMRGHSGGVTSVAFSPDGKTLASGSQDKSIMLWDVATRQRLGSALIGHRDAVLSIAFSPDGRSLVSGSADYSILLWDVAGHQPLGPSLIWHTDWVLAVAFSPDGKTFASGSRDGTFRVWDTTTRQPIGNPLAAAADWVTSLAFSPNGQTLAVGSQDGTFQLWDVAARRPLGQPFSGHAGGVNSLAYSPDGNSLASGSSDATIMMWDVGIAAWQARGCAIAGRNLTHAEWEQYLPGQAYQKTCGLWPDGQ